MALDLKKLDGIGWQENGQAVLSGMALASTISARSRIW